jgi:hypothetical protein
MSNSIRLHPKHGVNPTMGVCFWCGQDDGTVVLLGHNRGKEAQRHTVVTYEPCDTCKDSFSKGFTVVEADTKPFTEGQPPMDAKGGIFPSGRFVVLTEAGLNRLFNAETVEVMKQKKRAFMDVEAFKACFGSLEDTKGVAQ